MPLKRLAQRTGSTATPGCGPNLGRTARTGRPRAPLGGTGIFACAELALAAKIAALCLLLVLLAPARVRAEYVVLRTGERLHVTGYQLLGDKYRLQMTGGWVEVQASDVAAIEPEDVFTPIPPPPAGSQGAVGPPYRELVEAAASRYGVDAELITSVIAVESNFDPKAVSRKNARGLMQLLPETAARMGVKDVFDPKENIDAGTHYLKELLQLYNNDLVLTLAAYNAGPDRVQQYGNVPPYPETISYVRRVKRTYENSKSSPASKTAKPSGPTAGAAPGTATSSPAATPGTASNAKPTPGPPPSPQAQ